MTEYDIRSIMDQLFQVFLHFLFSEGVCILLGLALVVLQVA